jgi:hypothetical protein
MSDLGHSGAMMDPTYFDRQLLSAGRRAKPNVKVDRGRERGILRHEFRLLGC